MRVAITDSEARFELGDVAVGSYVLDDPFKPYLHPIRTISGHVVSLAMPSDHRHHKGVMYALTATDVNWWEEVPVEGYVDTPGVQKVVSTHRVGQSVISQQLVWAAADGSMKTFLEQRHISASWHPGGFVRWTWRSEIEALRNVSIRHSPWAEPHRDRMVNYHGLGIRFPREFGFDPKQGAWRSDGVEGLERVLGSEASNVVVTDIVDGKVPAPRVSVRVTQVGSQHGWFAASRPGFSYLSVGPSVLPELLELQEGTVLHEEYLLDVADGDPFGPAI